MHRSIAVDRQMSTSSFEDQSPCRHRASELSLPRQLKLLMIFGEFPKFVVTLPEKTEITIRRRQRK